MKLYAKYRELPNVNSIWWILKHMISWPVEVIRGNTENIENLNLIAVKWWMQQKKLHTGPLWKKITNVFTYHYGILRRFIGLRGFLSINITCLKTRIFRRFLWFKIHEKKLSSIKKQTNSLLFKTCSLLINETITSSLIFTIYTRGYVYYIYVWLQE